MAWNVGRSCAGTAERGVAQARRLGDVGGEVAHALERGRDPQRGHDDAQVGGDGLLQGRDLEAVGLDLGGDRVDGLVAGDDALGEREVGVEQRLGRPVHRRADEPRHLDEVVADPVELLVVGLAHG